MPTLAYPKFLTFLTMNPIKHFFWFFILLLTGVWWMTDPAWVFMSNFLGWRYILMQYTGVLAMGVMSAAMLLAVRPVVFEPYAGGLDKMYRLHKWLGISGLVMSLCHWLLSESPKWLVGLGWMARHAHGARHAVLDGTIQQFFQNQRGLAKDLGEWAFYAAVLLLVLALMRRFPYKHFIKIHHLLAVTYLALVLHSVVLLKFDYWSGLLGPVMTVLMTAGSIAALMVLLGQVAKNRQAIGEVVGIRHHASLGVIEVDIQVKSRWLGHQSGQFVFVTFHEDEGAHPYTIASPVALDGCLTFIIKALGDYTSTLAHRIKIKDEVKIEGPYGCFNFQGQHNRQIWVGAGIGITPFISRMKTLAHAHENKTIDLFHTTERHDQHAMELLAHDAKAAHVRLHVLWDEKDGLLDAARIAKEVPEWQDADIWFCGPVKFGQALKNSFVVMGLDEACFHQELFEMR